jgi:hypothetical protein
MDNSSVSNARTVELTDSLPVNFKIRFNYFRSHATDICIFGTTFYVEVDEASKRK